MEEYISETLYPLYFRNKQAAQLGQEIKNRHSVILVGMKRVGISNFLRFFIYQQKIQETFIHDQKKHLFIAVDLNDMVEREIFPFWILTFKRIVDAVEASTIPQETKKEIQDLFLNSIQINDQFMMIENIRKTLSKIIELGLLPTIFLIRFDRMQQVATENFFANLKGLQDSMSPHLSFVITCFRPLEDLIPKLKKSFLSSFTHPIFLKPASEADQKVLLDTYQVRYGLNLNPNQKKQLFDLVGGHIRFLQLAMIILNENHKLTFEKVLKKINQDERIMLQAEELWESLTQEEQQILKKMIDSSISANEIEKHRYLIETGFVINKNNQYQIFTSFLDRYIKNHTISQNNSDNSIEFTKKELALFTFLQKNLNQVCERDQIIEAVWTDEEEALEVSDWAMDRLVARVRAKLKKQKSDSEILTIRTRGYKLITS
jgi:DNA-binding winged helix-turn-helix (wHTH) protein